ncbi:MAG: pyridoxamine 5'-phosphate oxidase family protein [Proteobacteria bacterium]|nr:pyridoxamine 5'-phosphate oxidase family protein [Pseudomonadota bacterium]MBU1581900.1 pyridoxamine 5'-phosphate oxidase family protein [Pseudomonadota bacterium]MBU2631489.1 pyridoxamine 5'-phosphate oxidase family protein [Pseudomonadota bacterium]
MENIKTNWDKLRKDFIHCQKSSFGGVKIATVDAKGNPNITPIGSLFLLSDQKGFFCNRFPVNLNKNLETNNSVCIIALNSSKLFWLKSLVKGKFSTCPGLKLYGQVGEKRDISASEKLRWEKMVRPFRVFKGYDLLWKDMKFVSDISFDSFEYIKAGKMTKSG